MMVCLLAVLALGLAAAVPAAWLAARSVTVFLLGTYVVAVAAVAVVTVALSLVDRLDRDGYLVAVGALLAGAAVSFALRRPPLPDVRAGGTALREALRDPLVATLSVVVALELTYAALLGALTAPNDDDALAYHLARPAFWLQQGHAGYLRIGEDVRLDAFPPLDEALNAFVLGLEGGDRLVAGVALTATAALVVGVLAIGLRIGLDRRAALFGALLAATFPIVAFQAQSALNDLTLTALVVAAFALLLTRTIPALALAGLATALALATKVTGLLALPMLAVVALVAWWPRWRPLALVGAGSLVAGSTWYVVNLAHTHDPFGRFPAEQRGGTHPVVTLTRTVAIALNTFELPGAHGRDALVFVLAAVPLAVAGVVSLVLGRRSWRTLLPVAALLAAVPLVLPAGTAARKVADKAWYVLGWDDVGYVDAARDRTVASTLQSGAGALGLLATLTGLVLVVVAVRRRALPRVAIVLAAGPVVWIVLVGVAVAYFPWNARFTLVGYALAAATWGIALRHRVLAWSAVAIAAVSLFVAYANLAEKPSGLTLLEHDRPRTAMLPVTRASVFGLPRWRVQATRRDVAPVLRFLQERVPTDATVAAWPFFFPETRDAYAAGDLLAYPLFGPHLTRHVVLTTSPTSDAALGAGWYLAPTAALAGGCVPGWAGRLVQRDGWTILERAPGRTC